MDSGENYCAVLTGPKQIEVKKCPIPDPKSDEVLLAMRRVGVCGTDIQTWKTCSFNGKDITGSIFGHECSGEVIKVGENVTHLREGDKVSVYPAMICGYCRPCKSGTTAFFCDNKKFLAYPPLDIGGMMKYLAFPTQFVHKVPSSMTFEEAASMEPLGVCLRACKKGGVTLGSKVLIIGPGPIGLDATLIAKALGAVTVCVTGTRDKRLKIVLENGADLVLKIDKSRSAENVAHEVKTLMGCEPDCVIETTGSSTAVLTGIHSVKKGGKVVLVGLNEDAPVPVPNNLVVYREIEIIGSIIYGDIWPELIEIVSSGKVNLKPLIYPTYKLRDAQEAFEVAAKAEGMKIMIDCGN